MADMLQPSLMSCDPMATGPRRIMANMLLMSAFKVGNPVEETVLMKAHDFTRGPGYCCSHGFHVSATGILRSLPLTCVRTRARRGNLFSHFFGGFGFFGG
jgi:hypothetical protein